MSLAHGTSQSGGYHYFLNPSARQLQRSLESLIGEFDWCPGCPLGTERIDEECLYVRGDIHARLRHGVKEDRRVRDQRRIEHQDIEIIAEMRAPATVPRAAPDPRETRAELADAAKVVIRFTGEEDVRRRVDGALGAALELSTASRQRLERDLAADGDEYIRVLGARLGAGQRPEERNTPHAGDVAGRADEGKREAQKGAADLAAGARVILPLIRRHTMPNQRSLRTRNCVAL